MIKCQAHVDRRWRRRRRVNDADDTARQSLALYFRPACRVAVLHGLSADGTLISIILRWRSQTVRHNASWHATGGLLIISATRAGEISVLIRCVSFCALMSACRAMHDCGAGRPLYFSASFARI